jgi:hypothetical protein
VSDSPTIHPELTLEEAEALLPWRGADKTPEQWNRRLDAAEDAQRKLRAALREVSTEQPDEQGALL